MNEYRYGFKTEAERHSEAIRAELGIRNIDALSPFAVAEHLAIPVLSLSTLAALRSSTPGLQAAVDTLQSEAQSSLSAMTVFGPAGSRTVIYNDRHDPGRTASDVMHELAHGLLLHPPSVAFDETGCRAWNTEIEKEATYLGAVLLIPGKGARYIAKAGMSLEGAAKRFGCSQQMVTWRLNGSGARRIINSAG